MARTAPKSSTKSTGTTPNETAQEGTVTSTETTPTEATTPATETVAPAAETATEVDFTAELKAFDETAANVHGSRAEDGTFTDEALAPLLESFNGLPSTKARNAARASMQAKMTDAMMADQAVEAKAWMLMGDATKTAKAAGKTKAEKAPKAPVDPTADFVAKYTSIRLAAAILSGNVPEGVSATWKESATALANEVQDQAQTYGAYLANPAEDKVEPENISPVVVAAFKIANGRAAGSKKAAKASSGSSYSGPQRSVKAHIESALAAAKSGDILSVGDIVKHKSAEYGDDAPSQGAVSAAITSAKFDPKALGVEVVTEPRKGLKKV